MNINDLKPDGSIFQQVRSHAEKNFPGDLEGASFKDYYLAGVERGYRLGLLVSSNVMQFQASLLHEDMLAFHRSRQSPGDTQVEPSTIVTPDSTGGDL